MGTEQGLLNQIILWLWNRHSKAARNFFGKLADLHEGIAKIYPTFSDQELECFLKAPRGNFLEHNKFLFLEPPQDGDCLLPILTLVYDFDSNRTTDLAMRIALFVFDENNQTAAIGYRFESPEGGDRHNYFHAQPIRSFSLNGDNLPCCPNWLPDKYPSFALDAQNIPSLFVSLLISLYGLNFKRELQSASYWDLLKPYIEDKMLCLNLPVHPALKHDKQSMNVRKSRRRK